MTSDPSFGMEGTPGDPNALAGRRVLVMGLGLLGGGVGAARYAAEQGAAEIVVTDLRGPDFVESVNRDLEIIESSS